MCSAEVIPMNPLIALERERIVLVAREVRCG